MSSLRELQHSFRVALLGDNETPAGLAGLIASDGLDVAERLDIYRNNVLSSLVKALAATFPAVSRLVDERFFAYAATEFIREQPPRQACLGAYGGDFPDFLEKFPPCRELAYLADVARIEWAISVALQAPDADPIDPSALADVAPEATGRLRLSIHPSAHLLESPFPVDRIWRGNRPDGAESEAIDLAEGAALQIARYGEEVLLQRLDRASFMFRSALLAGATLAAAAQQALDAQADFDLPNAVGNLFREGLVVGFSHQQKLTTED